MKNLVPLFCLMMAALNGSMVFAKCDGIPINSEGPECFIETNRKSCEYIKGCKWTTEAAIVRLCNRTTEKLSVGTRQIRPNYNVIYEEGWWILEAGQCQDLQAPNATSLSYFAKTYQGNNYWIGNGEPMCYDSSGNSYSRIRQLSDSCGADTEIRSYQTIPVKEDDFIKANIQGPGQDLSPEPVSGNNGAGKFKAKALAWAPPSGNYAVRKGANVEEAKKNALEACQSSGEKCELAFSLGTDRLACMAILSGEGNFRAWSWSYDGKEAAINRSLQYCQNYGQTCRIDFVSCNNE